ncbi:MAG: hypothetical protein V1927_02565 [Candidatus Omnitrophota bacterium]
MAKTIETLKTPVFKEDVLHSHIAETYFHKNSHTKTRKKKSARRLNIDFPRLFITWAIVAALSLLAFISIAFLHNRYIEILRKSTAALKVIDVVTLGSANKAIIKKFEFRGQARRGKNSEIKDSVILNNPKKYNWADLSVDFKFPVDLSERAILLSLRGATGGEKLNVVLRDTKNRSSRLSDISLSSNLKDKMIHMDEFKGDIDLGNINHLRLEYGHAGESGSLMDSPINVTIYVNNITLPKEEKV